MRVEFFYDFSCPYAYLASTQIERLAKAHGAELVFKPMLLGGVFQAIGAPMVPSMPPAKARHNALDMQRWAAHWGVPLTMPESHPIRTVLALRSALAAGADVARATHALFRAYWVDAKDVSQPEVVRAALDAAGLDGAALVARADAPELKADLRARTDDAVARGVFGAPALVVSADGDAEHAQLFWGQDRLDFVERALDGWAAGAPTSLTPSNPGIRVLGSVVAREETPASRNTHPTGAARLDFFFDFSSPFAYLASTAVEGIARRTAARLVYRPFLLGALFKKIGTPDVPLFSMPEAKRRYAMRDIARWADVRAVPLVFPSRFPVNTVKPLRMVLAAPDLVRPQLVAEFFRAIWVEDRDVGLDAELAGIAERAGADADALLEAARGEAMRAALRVATDEAEAAGVCGAPCFAVDGMTFWGQDRLAFVEAALNGWRPACG
ncbi:MAG TPA: 2-hydroxychromene-2-carboxylate isomerase [Byssovorax sp.]